MNTIFRRWMLSALTACVMALQGTAVAQENAQSSPPAESASPSVEVETKTDETAVEREDAKTSISVRTRGSNEIVHIGSDSHLPAGNTSDAVVAIVGSATSEGTVTDAVVAIMGDARATGFVGDTVVAVMGNTYVNSKIGGDVVAVFGNVELGPEAEVSGDVVSVGGVITRDPAAVVHGDVSEVSLPVHVGQLDWSRPWIRHALLYGRPLAVDSELGWAWAIALGFLAFYVLLSVMFPAGIRRCVRTLEAQPGASLLTAILSLLITPMLVIVLLITVIGIAMLPFLWLGLFFMGLFGKAVILAAIGRRVIGGIEGPAIRVPVAVVVGGTIMLLLYLVPIVGNILYLFTGFLGFGVVAYTLLTESKAKRAPRMGPVPPGGGPSTTPRSGGPSPFAPPPPTGSAPFAPPSAFSPASDSSASTPPLTRPGAAPPGTRVEPHLAESSFSASSRVESEPQFSESHITEPDFTESKSSAGAASPGAEEPAVSPSASTSPNSAATPQQTLSLTAAAVSLPRASFVVRMGALAIDMLLIAAIVNNIFDHAEVFSMILVPLAIYGAVMWKLKGSTIGGIVCNIQVVRLDGREIDWATAIVRALSCFLSLIAAGLGFLWMLFDSERQTWHDKIAGTVVVRVPKGMSLV